MSSAHPIARENSNSFARYFTRDLKDAMRVFYGKI